MGVLDDSQVFDLDKKKSTIFTFTEMRNRGEGGRLLGGEKGKNRNLILDT